MARAGRGRATIHVDHTDPLDAGAARRLAGDLLDGGPTEVANLVLLCPYHHRLHHRGVIAITGPPSALVVTDHAGRVLSPGSVARPPTQPPPAVAPCPGPTGERAQWWWYEPFQPQSPPHN
jgi:hypothetical protein